MIPENSKKATTSQKRAQRNSIALLTVFGVVVSAMLAAPIFVWQHVTRRRA
jgi:hypothetical protein